jgi:hypothetical protein
LAWRGVVCFCRSTSGTPISDTALTIMPRQEQIRITTDKVVKGITVKTEESVYTVTYLDDSPERQEAVRYFRSQGDWNKLFFHSDIPWAVHQMPFEKAQAYLDAHPVQEQWRGLNLLDVKNQATDDDLARLRHIPEIEILQIRSNKITDDGIRHICQLVRLETLFIFSDNITDTCLEHIARIKTLKLLDLQGASQVTWAEYSKLVKSLPLLKDSYPPTHAVPPIRRFFDRLFDRLLRIRRRIFPRRANKRLRFETISRGPPPTGKS